jgi:hypothetical protein
MTRPGDRLRALAARVCSARTMERVIDPLIADLQCEHAAPPRAWRRCGIRLSGYVAFWKTACLHTGHVSSDAAFEWLSAEDWVTGRTLAFSGVAVATITAALLVPSFHKVFFGGSVLYLIPAVLAVALPFGFMGGVLVASRGRLATRHSNRGVVAIAIVLTATQFASFNWIVPSANQTFRVRALEAIGGQPPIKGYNEMTLRELRLEIQAQRLRGSPELPARMQYDLRWAFCATPVILGFLAITLANRRRGVLSCVAVVAATQLSYMAYFDWAARLVRTTDALRVPGGPLVVAIAWIPNVGVALLAAILLTRGRLRLERATS